MHGAVEIYLDEAVKDLCRSTDNNISHFYQQSDYFAKTELIAIVDQLIVVDEKHHFLKQISRY